MGVSNQTLLCILYEENVKHGDYDTVKIEVEIEDETHRKCVLLRFSGDKRVEGLFYGCDALFSQTAERLGFDLLTTTTGSIGQTY